MAVIGDDETETDAVAFRARGGQQFGTLSTEVFLGRLSRTVSTKTAAADLAS